MSLEDDEKWLDILSGHDDGTHVDPRLKGEAEALRRAILNRYGKNDQEEPPLDEGSLDRMLFRLKREGLLETKKAKPHWYGSVPAAVAAVLALALVLPLAYQLTSVRESQLPGDQDLTQMRGGAEMQQVLSDDPARTAADFRDELEALDIQPKVDEFEGRWYVDVHLPVPLTGKVKEFLDRHGLESGQGGRLILEIYSGSR